MPFIRLAVWIGLFYTYTKVLVKRWIIFTALRESPVWVGSSYPVIGGQTAAKFKMPNSSQQKMNEKSRRELCRKYISGIPAAQLAKDYHRSVHTVKGLLNTHVLNGKYRTLKDIRYPLGQSHADEKWKPLRVSSKTRYLLSNYGRIRNAGTGGILQLRIIFGYFSFEYTDQVLNKKQAKLVHVLMAEHWLKNYNPALNTTHLDYDKFNNHYRNLRQVTPGQRAKRVAERGLSKHFKLTNEKVKQIKSSNESPAVVARRFNVSTMQVMRIRRGDCWSHVLPGKTRAKQPTPGTPPQTVARIKTLLAEGKKGKAIAALLGVTETTVSRIKRGKTYKTQN